MRVMDETIDGFRLVLHTDGDCHIAKMWHKDGVLGYCEASGTETGALRALCAQLRADGRAYWALVVERRCPRIADAELAEIKALYSERANVGHLERLLIGAREDE